MSEIPLLTLCPCGSQKEYSLCCEPLLIGQKTANSPEALMRSRYTAFTQSNIDYLFATMTLELQRHNDLAEMQDFIAKIDAWLKLDIIDAPHLVAEATQGMVEFAAYFLYEGQQQRMHERSEFIKKEGQWLYAGHQHQCRSHAHEDDDHDHQHMPEARFKVGRNDPCPCGSGQKYKKCCLE